MPGLSEFSCFDFTVAPPSGASKHSWLDAVFSGVMLGRLRSAAVRSAI